MISTGSMNSNDIKSIALKKFEENDLSVEAIILDSNDIVKQFIRFFPDTTIAYDAQIFSYTSFMDLKWANFVAKTYYYDGSTRSYERYQYVGNNWCENKSFFDSNSKQIYNSEVFMNDTINGFYVTSMTDSTSIFRMYSNRKSMFEIEVKIDTQGSNCIVYKWKDLGNNKEFTKKRELKRVLRNYIFLNFSDELILINKMNYRLPVPKQYTYKKYRLINQ